MLDETSEAFVAIPSSNYKNWGTLGAWRAYCRTKKTVWGKNVGENLIDLDGDDKEL
jgi:hypothetical protein